MSFRKTIQNEARRRGLSGYRLAKMAGMPLRTVQAYLSEERDLTGERISMIAAALDLELKPRGRPRKGKVS